MLSTGNTQYRDVEFLLAVYQTGSNIVHGVTPSTRAKTLFRSFVEGTAEITVSDDLVEVRVEKRGRNPMLMELAEAYPDVNVPWWGGRHLAFEFI